MRLLCCCTGTQFHQGVARLSVSRSALSHTIRGLATRLGLPLLTRNVASTKAGEHLVRTTDPRLNKIEAELTALNEMPDKPAGTVRITAGEHAAGTIVRLPLATLMPDYPDIHLEVIVDYGLTDIVAERYASRIRLSDHVAEDRVAVQIGFADGRRWCTCLFQTAAQTGGAR